ncbi:hypothetical protein Tco_1269698 [Tanacetum coccineum]
MLKGCLDKKDFTWTKEVDKAFEEMKRYIEKPPTLVAPKAGENLIVYLAALKEYFRAETKEEDEETDFEEKQQTEQTTRWKLYIDGASSGDGSGASLMLTKKVLVENLAKKSIHEKQIAEAIVEEKNSWMTPIIEYLVSDILPADKKLERKVRVPGRQRKLLEKFMEGPAGYTLDQDHL